MAEAKTVETGASVEAFLDAVENETRREDAKKVLALMKKITKQKAKMWGPSIIGFGKYHYRYESGHEGECCKVGFSPRKANLVLYVGASCERNKTLLAKLGKHKIGKSCLYLNKLSDVDMKVLAEIIELAYVSPAMGEVE